MVNLLKVFSFVILCSLPSMVAAKLNPNNPYFKVSDSFICTTDALITVGDDNWENPSSNGEVLEYKNVSFGFTIKSEDEIDFTDSYPLGLYQGAADIFPINEPSQDIYLYYGVPTLFGQIIKVRPSKWMLKAFNITSRTSILQATCEKL